MGNDRKEFVLLCIDPFQFLAVLLQKQFFGFSVGNIPGGGEQVILAFQIYTDAIELHIQDCSILAPVFCLEEGWVFEKILYQEQKFLPGPLDIKISHIQFQYLLRIVSQHLAK